MKRKMKERFPKVLTESQEGLKLVRELCGKLGLAEKQHGEEALFFTMKLSLFYKGNLNR